MTSDNKTTNTLRHKKRLEQLYQNVKFPQAIDWWVAHFARDEMDIAISNARHLDPVRQKIENRVWKKIVPQNGAVLDLGIGRGFFSKRLSEVCAGNLNLFGMDLSEAILQQVKVEHQEISLVLGAAEKMPFRENAFDDVLVISTLEHIADSEPVIPEIKRILKPRGYLYLCLHKPFLDPFILPTLAKRAFARIREMGFTISPAGNEKTITDTPEIGFKGPLRKLRWNLKKWLSEAGFEWVDSGTLLPQWEWRLYKKLVPRAIPGLIRIGQRLNRLPFDYYKDLEYWLLRKK
ncbi:class I SAM-dependent methyltransferase [Thermodesulfobacteriota bacterium]